MANDYFLILICLLLISVAASTYSNHRLTRQQRRQNDILERIAAALEKRG